MQRLLRLAELVVHILLLAGAITICAAAFTWLYLIGVLAGFWT